jgi:kynurenine formamidase
MALPADVTELGAAVRNWGRWGGDDQLGTLNLIDAAARRRGVASAVGARPFSLAIDWSADGPQIGAVPGRTNPEHAMTQVNAPAFDPDGVRFNDDRVVMGLQAATHWDGLAHVSYRGHLYNGYPADSVTAAGAAQLGIHRVGALASRGVLLDVARARGVEQLPGGHAVTAGDLDLAAEQARVDVQPGDVVLVRTGHIRLLRAEPPDRGAYVVATPGPSLEAVRWFRRHDVAAVATDNYAFEVFPAERPEAVLAVHYLHIVEMGLTQGQNWDLEALAADCAEDGRYTFLLVAPPEPMVGGTGAPVHPVALK